MRIAHVITRLISGGADENTVLSCNGQVRRGHAVLLIHGAEATDKMLGMVDPRVEVLRDPALVREINPMRDIGALMNLVRHLRRFAPDVVHTHTSKAGILGRVAAKLAGARSIVHGVHILPFLNVGLLERFTYLAAERAVAPLTQAFVNVSEGMRSAGLDAGLGAPSRHVVIRSGMDVAAFAEASPGAGWREWIGGWDKTNRPLVILMLAVFERRKRQALFVEAVASWLRTRSDILLVLAGDGPERARCQQIVAELGLTERVRLPGHVDKPQELVALADLCILTSEREGLPRVIIQYLAAGKPVVTSPLPGVEEVIVDGHNGCIADSPAISDVARAVIAMCEQPNRLAQLAAGARATDVSAWSLERMIADLDILYERLVGREAEAAKEVFSSTPAG